MSNEAKPGPKAEGDKGKEKKKPIKIPLPVLPSDDSSLDDEMNELFNEDKVTHKHGTSEPERD